MEYQSQNISQGSLTVLIATIITTKIVAKFELDATFYGIVYVTMIQSVDYLKTLILDSCMQTYIKNIIHDVYQSGTLLSFTMVLALVATVTQVYNNFICVWITNIFKNFTKEKKYKELTLYDVNKTMDIATYMNRYSDYFKGYDEVKRSDSSILQSLMGNVYKTSDTSRWLTRLNGTTVPVVNQQIIVDDKKYGVKGFIVWYDNQLSTTEYGVAKDDKTVHKVNFKYVKVTLDVDSPALVEKYIEDISRAVNKEINESFIAAKLMTCESFDYDMATKTIGYMKDYDMEEMEKIFITTFFHPEKNTLWKYLKKIKMDPNYFYKFGQVPQMNLLLHGPPGTGKSSFSYRIARTLGRSIITVDLRVIKKKSMLYSIMEKPVIDGRCYSPSQIVYVFDEFDMTVKYLHALQIKKNNEEKMWKNRIEGYYNSYDSGSYMGGMSGVGGYNNKFTAGIKQKKGASIESSHTNSTCSSASLSDSNNDYSSDDDDISDDNSNDDLLDRPDRSIRRKKSYFKKTQKKLKKKKNKKKKSNTELNYSIPDNISLQDLLEILQGPIPVEQRIIIATTNDYEGIKDLCPALFRSGRLTPILFDTPSRDIIKEITKYYFKRDIDIELPNKIKKPTSEIIDLCLKANTFDDPYKYYITNLKMLIKN